MSTSQRTLALGAGTLELQEGDITRCSVDAIVNAANQELQVGAGVCGAIHRKGGRAIDEECAGLREQRGGCATGHAVITTAGRLPARHVLHAVGPIWRGGHQDEARLLASCYHACGALAREFRLDSVAFPPISTGIYGYPLKPAARMAVISWLRWNCPRLNKRETMKPMGRAIGTKDGTLIR